MSYRYYRLANTTAIRSTSSVTRIHQIFNNLELTMKDIKLSGEDLILIFEFLSLLFEEDDALEMDK